jgi:hypothetical protein
MIALQLGWYLPPQKIPLAENRFLQACWVSSGLLKTGFLQALGSNFCLVRYASLSWSGF